MRISGLSSHPKTTLKVILPDRTLTVGEKTFTDGKYDFEFPIDKTYPKGNYTIRAEYGTYIVDEIVEVKELFTLSKTAHTFTFTDATTRLTENMTVRNMMNGTNHSLHRHLPTWPGFLPDPCEDRPGAVDDDHAHAGGKPGGPSFCRQVWQGDGLPQKLGAA